jgi:mono/diheme cytochrome c family protein
MSDGRTWDFSQAGEGLRNTIDLRGRAGMGHGPVHWSANFDEIQDFENDIVHAFGGTGLAADGEPPYPPLYASPNAGRSADLDDLAAYVASLAEVPRSPHRAPDGDMDDAARRGRALFFDEAVGCASCHAPPSFTDSHLDANRKFVLHDVGTLGEGSGGRLGGPLPGLDTPSLLGAWATPPYLHDGSAATLREVIRARNPDDAHGATSHLSDAEIDDLVAYLRVIDDLEAAEGPGGCGCSLACHPPRGPWLGVLLPWTLVIVAWRKR